MLRLTPPVTLRLERGRLLSWPRQAGVRLRVLAGTAWVTQAHDMEDHFLQPGHTLVLRPGSRSIISAEQDVSLHFEAEAGFGWSMLARRLRALRLRRAPAMPCGARPA